MGFYGFLIQVILWFYPCRWWMTPDLCMYGTYVLVDPYRLACESKVWSTRGKHCLQILRKIIARMFSPRPRKYRGSYLVLVESFRLFGYMSCDGSICRVFFSFVWLYTALIRPCTKTLPNTQACWATNLLRGSQKPTKLHSKRLDFG